MKAGGELAEMAEAERPLLEEKIEKMEQEVRILLLPKDAADDKNVILELRAGTGGDEAAIFAGDLFRMYQRYAASKGWRVEVISTSEGEHGGYKEVIANIYGAGAFAHMKFESGVHGAHHPHPDWPRGGPADREVAAQEQECGDEAAAGASL